MDVRRLAGLIATVALVALGGALSAVPAVASEGCSNEARRVEQGSTALPDCRAYELVSQPYQSTPRITSFEANEDVPNAITTAFRNSESYSPEPAVLPQVSRNAFVAADGHSAIYSGEEATSESHTVEAPINLSHRGSGAWAGESIIPHESEHAGWGCPGTQIEGFSPSLEQIAIRMGGGQNGEDYEHCGHDEPPLVEKGESKETANLFIRATAGSSWSLLSVYPPGIRVFAPWANDTEEGGQYEPVFAAVSADGSHGVFSSLAQLDPDAPNGEILKPFAGLEGHCATEWGNVYVESAGEDHVLTVPPDGIPVRGTFAGARARSEGWSGCGMTPPLNVSFSHAVAANGERILFYAGGGFRQEPLNPGPRAPYIDGGLYLRIHPGAEQSALEHGGAAGAGTLTAGSSTVGSLHVTLAAGVGQLQSGSDEVTELGTLTGEFVAGQAIEGQGIPAGTTIVEVTEKAITLGTGATETVPIMVLSSKATESAYSVKLTAVSEGPGPFAVGQTVTGKGIPAGTTITSVAHGSLTLSAAATAGGSGVTLEGASECTEAEKACAVQIDVPEADASGSPGGGQFQWANAETTKIFFTDDERLTSDSTAESGSPDLYEYDTERPAGQRLTDVTVNASEAANVLGVSGVSEDGSYVYFVAQADLSGSQQNSHGAAALGRAQGSGELKGISAGYGNLTAGSTQVSGFSAFSEFWVGQEVTGEGGVIPAGTTVVACTPSCSSATELTLSNPATATTFSYLYGQGSDVVTGVSTTSGAFASGMAIAGAGIPAHTWIKEVGSGTLTLSQVATESGKQTLTATAANLYLRHGGTTTFVATLTAEDGDQCDWTEACLTSRVSANGLYIAFNSIEKPTGYDNVPVKPTACNYLMTGDPKSTAEVPCIEAYRYAAASGAHGELTCATCPSDGRPPEAEFGWSLIRQAYRFGPTGGDGYQIVLDHPMADSGQFFFETEEKLVSTDENGINHQSTDVYEYSGGEGPTARYHLISTGKSGAASEFLDASADGSNVFFSTAESLLRADTRSGYDIYDARVNGGLASQDEAIQEEPCTSVEGCHSPLTEPPGEFSAGSASLFGAGNLTPAPEKPEAKKIGARKLTRCRKGFVRRHGKCVKKHVKKLRGTRGKRGGRRRVGRSRRGAGK